MLNLTVTSAGRQFDRLAFMFLDDAEIFRTSTAEPTESGIVWTYIKDVSPYLSLFQKPHKIIFDLGNLIDETYTASFNATLTATFRSSVDTSKAADLIIPLSASRSSTNLSSAFSVPGDVAKRNLSLPRNVNRAIFSISACGQAKEEFWWSNVLSSNELTFPETGLYGYSPFREIQLYVDEQLMGVSWPFPIIFTGGVVPGLWRPVVGIDAFDLQEDEVDVTPALPLLCDGQDHSFEIRVVGISDDRGSNGSLSEAIGDYWMVTGKVFLWLDPTDSVTTGSGPLRLIETPTIRLASSVNRNSEGVNETLTYDIQVNRQLSISSEIRTSDGWHFAQWTHSLSYDNQGYIWNRGQNQITHQNTKGAELSSGGYSRRYSYPLVVNSSFARDEGSKYFTIHATIDRGKSVTTKGDPVHHLNWSPLTRTARPQYEYFDRSALNTRQNGSATYRGAPALSKSFSFGSMEQDMTFAAAKGPPTDLESTETIMGNIPVVYSRHLLAINGSVVRDHETFHGDEILKKISFPAIRTEQEFYGDSSINEFLGRGLRFL